MLVGGSTPADGISKTPGGSGLPTMQQLAANVLFAEALHRATTAIAPLNAEGNRVPIFWVHSVTGRGTDPLDLARQLGPDQPFYSLRVPSKKRDAALATSVDGLARFYVDEIAKFQPVGPMIIGGWSAGVVVALEMAQQLQTAGRDVRHLVAVDFAPLNSSIRINPLLELMWRTNNWLRKEGDAYPSFRRLRRRFRQKMLEITRLANLTTHPMDDLVASLGCSRAEGAFVRTLHDKIESYVPRPYGGSVLFYFAAENSGRQAIGSSNGHASRMARAPLAFVGRLIMSKHASHMVRVWTAIANRLAISKIAGSHSSLMKGDAVVALAQHMRADLERPQSHAQHHRR